MDKRKWGDRRDGVWLRELPALNRIMPPLMPNRTDNEAYVSLDIDLRPLEAYLEKKNEGRTGDKYTFFHLIAAAAAKAFVLRPRMNRFICNNRFYQRKNVTVAFVVKKQFDDRAEEGLAYLEYAPKETLDSFHEKVMQVIHTARKEEAGDTTSDSMDFFSRLPQWLLVAGIRVVRFLDRHGWAPQAVVGTSPQHAAVFLSNLGSIGLEGGYHHLVNFGTNSCFIVVGKKYRTVEYDENGTGDCHEVIPLGITLDERIADGYYYAGTVALVKELLLHPELLELPADTPVEYAAARSRR